MNHGNRFTRLTCGGEQENNVKGKERKGKERKAMHKKSQKCYILRGCEGGTPGAISMKFGLVVHMVNVVNSAKFDHCNSIGLHLATVFVSPNVGSPNVVSPKTPKCHEACLLFCCNPLRMICYGGPEFVFSITCYRGR
jgi:hypothetical protein